MARAYIRIYAVDGERSSKRGVYTPTPTPKYSVLPAKTNESTDRSLVVCAMAAEAVVPGKQKHNKVLPDVDELFQILPKNKRDGKHQMWEMWDVIKEAEPALVNQPPASEQCWFKSKTCGQLLSPSNPSRLYADHYKNLVNGVGVCAGLRGLGGAARARQQQHLRRCSSERSTSCMEVKGTACRQEQPQPLLQPQHLPHLLAQSGPVLM